MKKIFLILLSLFVLFIISVMTLSYYMNYGRHVLIVNKSNVALEKVQMSITYGTNTENEKTVSSPAGRVESGSELKIPLDSSDSTLSIQFNANGEDHNIVCGYTTGGVSHKLVIKDNFKSTKCEIQR